MPSILIVEKNGNIKSQVVKNLVVSELYKKAGFKTNEGFKQYTNWKLEIDDTPFNVHLFGKTEGRANQENKYDFPPPVDSTLFFGNCVLVNIVDNVVRDLEEDDWETIYEYLFGGFEDLGEEDSDEEELDTEDEIEQSGFKTTKAGYAADGFVVDDDDCDEEYICESSDESEEVKPKRKSKSKSKKPEKNLELLECESELSEEEYV
jgi:hypothetical protein